MRFDAYTKVVLTVIAISLILITGKSYLGSDEASATDVINVRIVESFDTIDVNLAEVVGRTLVESKTGMSIGVSSKNSYIIPINWGKVSIED